VGAVAKLSELAQRHVVLGVGERYDPISECRGPGRAWRKLDERGAVEQRVRPDRGGGVGVDGPDTDGELQLNQGVVTLALDLADRADVGPGDADLTVEFRKRCRAGKLSPHRCRLRERVRLSQEPPEDDQPNDANQHGAEGGVAPDAKRARHQHPALLACSFHTRPPGGEAGSTPVAQLKMIIAGTVGAFAATPPGAR